MTLSVDNRFLRKTIERSLKDLPPLPEVVARVLMETESPNATAAQVERLIGSDQALAAKVLRVVNSAYYGLSGQVTSLGQAVVILGMQQIRNLALSMAALSTFKPRTPRQQQTLQQFWMHSFGSAAAVQIIAKAKGLPTKDAETAFVGGLLHDIGRLFLFVNFTEIYDDLIRYAGQKDKSVDEAEIMFLGLTHAAVGEEMAKKWNMPPLLVQMIARHEGPFDAQDDPRLFAVHMGDYLCHHLYFSPDAGCAEKADPTAMAWLEFSDEDVEALKQTIDEKVEEAVSLFGLLNAA